jgi:hypothetical protein
MGYAIGVYVVLFFLKSRYETRLARPMHIGVGNGSFRRQADFGTLT